ncbi:DNA/RNA helicase domain-containing protein [Secundilactobacillus silagei]|uniref:DNA/RNA helicase domain-containing protein n=1 Tax=Secundilactobacillus silagei TaxID=1293415 RepID=UPI00209355EA|nr:DNA/RNA helicase domain-containing protein [Secundilactobacillus silagei]
MLRKCIDRSSKKNADQENSGISRLVATFDWKYTQNKRKDGKYWMVNAGNLSLPWNLQLKLSVQLKN